MGRRHEPDWDPRSEEVLRDQRAAYDRMRERCPVAYSELMQWSVFRHEDVVRVLLDPDTFSSAVSQHLSAPSGMDAPEHAHYRRIVDRYFSAERMNAFEAACRGKVVELLEELLPRRGVEWMAEFAHPLAVRLQCAFLGWPASLEEPLVGWTKRNFAATFAQDRHALSEIAREFEAFIDGQLDARRQSGAPPEQDITTALMHETVWGRALSNEEIASILRNWTVGEIGTIAAAIGILAHFLAQNPQIAAQLRSRPAHLPAANDEILRIDGPLIASRRVATRPVTLGGRSIEAEERISLNWISANRDGRVFDQPEEFRLDRDPSKNLLYGMGMHVCPGAPLARLELRVVMEELLGRAREIHLDERHLPARARYPASGFAALHVRLA